MAFIAICYMYVDLFALQHIAKYQVKIQRTQRTKHQQKIFEEL